MPCRAASSPCLDLLNLLPLCGSCPSAGISFGWFCLSPKSLLKASSSMKAWRGGWRFSHESCPRQTITSESKSGFKACPFFLNGKCCQQNWALSCRGQNQQLKDGWELEKREASLLPLWSAVQTCESDGEDANTSGLRTQRKQWVELGENPSATIPGGVSYFYFPPKAPRQVVVVQLLRCV